MLNQFSNPDFGLSGILHKKAKQLFPSLHEKKKIFVRYYESKIAIVFSYLKKHRKKMVLKVFPEKKHRKSFVSIVGFEKNIKNCSF